MFPSIKNLQILVFEVQTPLSPEYTPDTLTTKNRVKLTIYFSSRFPQNTKIGSIRSWLNSELTNNLSVDLESHDFSSIPPSPIGKVPFSNSSSTGKVPGISSSKSSSLSGIPGDFLLKHSAPPCSELDDDSVTLEGCGIVSNTLLVLELLDND